MSSSEVPPDPRGAVDPGLNVMELRTAIQQHLRQSGALRTLKTQLRGMVLTDLLHHHRGALQPRPAAAGDESMSLEEFEACRSTVKEHWKAADGSSPTPPPLSPAHASTWSGRVADCLIHNHLHRSQRDMSLSIFATEAEVPPLSDTGAPADEQQFLCQLLGLPAGAGSEREVSRQGALSLKSALQLLVEEALRRRGDVEGESHRHHCSTQTEDWEPCSEQTNPLTSMECRLAAVDAKYALLFSQQKQGGGGITWQAQVERQMAAYKEDLHQLLRAEYAQKYRSFEQTTLHETKESYDVQYQLYRQHQEEAFREKERTMEAKHEQERERLRHMREDMEHQRMRLEKKQLDIISFQQELESEGEKLRVQIREQRDNILTLRCQCEKWEELCATRLMEVEASKSREMRRTEELRRAQLEYSTNVHALEEEIHLLRLRLQTISQLREGEGGGIEEERMFRIPASTVGSAVPVEAALSRAAPTSSVAQAVSGASLLHSLSAHPDDDIARFIASTAQSQQHLSPLVGDAMLSANKAGHREEDRGASLPGGPLMSDKTTHSLEQPNRSVQEDISAIPKYQEQEGVPPVPGVVAATPSPPPLHSASEKTSSSPSTSVTPSAPAGSVPAAASPSVHDIIPEPSASSPLQASPTAAPTEQPLEGGLALPAVGVSSGVPGGVEADAPSEKATSKSSLLALAAEVLGKGKKSASSTSSTSSSTSSSSSSSSSSASKSNSSHKRAPPEKMTNKSLPGSARSEAALEAQLGRLVSAEAAARISIFNEEETNFKSIAWSFKTKLSVLHAQQAKPASSSRSSSSGSSMSGSGSEKPRRRVSWMLEQAEKERKKQQEELNIITRDSGEDDDILYNSSSTGSSF